MEDELYKTLANGAFCIKVLHGQTSLHVNVGQIVNADTF